MNKLDIRLKIKKFIMEDKIRTAKIIVICLIIFAGIGSYMMSKGGEKEEYERIIRCLDIQIEFL